MTVDKSAWPIWCCICLNLENHHRINATTVVNGYSVCDGHAELLSGPYSNFAQLIARLKVNATEHAT
jgi:hypothetical protein